MHVINTPFPIFKFLVSSALAMLVTLSLMLLMQQLVKTDFVVIDDPVITRISPPFMEKSPPTVIKKDPKDDRPKELDPPPVIEFSDPVTELNSKLTGVPVPQPKIVVAKQKGPGFHISDGEAIPVVRVAPEYPTRAQTRGIEGFVDIQFDIAPSGKTTNLQVVYAEPDRVFNKSALRAVGKWKYKPKVVNGNAVAQTGMKTRVRFGLEQ